MTTDEYLKMTDRRPVEEYEEHWQEGDAPMGITSYGNPPHEEAAMRPRPGKPRGNPLLRTLSAFFGRLADMCDWIDRKLR